MNPSTEAVTDQSGRLDDLLLAYLQSVEAGQPLDRGELIASHPELAAELREFFANQDGMALVVDDLPAPADGRSIAPRRIRCFGDYESLEEIAQGGMGVVFKARQKSLNRTVAVKMVLGADRASDSALRRFRAEAEAVAQLTHPGIVSVYEVGQHDGQPYYSMEYVPGASLADLARNSPLPAREAAEYIRQAAEAVHFAHQHGVLHRDLKPSNLILDPSGRVRITDFGLAKCSENRNHLTATGDVLGTPSYMPPEQASGQNHLIGPASDVYSLGAVLYELLTGRAPHRAATAVETLRQLQDTEPVSPRRLNPAVPIDLETIALKCLQKRVLDRYSTAERLADDLARFLRGEPIVARPIGRPARFWRWCRRNPMVAGLSAAVSLLLLFAAVVSGVAAWKIRNDRDRASLAEENERRAKIEYREALWLSHISRARATRANGLVGRRFAALEALRAAAAIRPSEEIRDEAITCLTLADLRHVGNWPESPRLTTQPAFDCDPAFEHFAAMEGEGEVVVRRIRDGALARRFPARGGEIVGLRFSPDGRKIAILHLGKRMTVRAVAGGEALLDIVGDFQRQGIEFSPDGSVLAASRRDKSLDLFEIVSGKTIARLKCRHAAWGARFHPRYPRVKQLAVCAGSATEVGIWTLGGEPAANDVKFPARIRDVAWDPEGRRLIAAGDDSDVHVYDTVNGELSSLPEGHSFVVNSVAAHPRLPLVATDGQDGQSFLWDLDAKLPVLRLDGMVVRWSGDGRRLAVKNGPHAGIWEWEPARESTLFHFTKRSANKVQRAAFHPRLPMVASAGPNGVRLWRTPSGQFLGEVGHAHTYDVAFDPRDGAIFVNDVNGLFRWPVESEPERGTVARARIGPPRRLDVPAGANETRGIAIDASGNTLVTTWPKRSAALVVDLRTGAVKPLATLPRVRYLAIDPAGRYVAFGTNKGRDVDVWDLRSFRHAVKLDSPGSAWPQFSGDGKWLAASSPNGYRVWEIGTWREVFSLPRQHEMDYGVVAFFPGTSIAAVASSRSVVQIVDLNSPRVLANLEPAQRPPELLDLDVNFDGSMLAVTQGHGGVRLWDLGRIQRQLASMGHSLDVPRRGAPDGDSTEIDVVIDPGDADE